MRYFILCCIYGKATKSHCLLLSISLMYMYVYIQGVSEICGQTLRAYSTCCKDEKSHIDMGPEMLPLQIINIFY